MGDEGTKPHRHQSFTSESDRGQFFFPYLSISFLLYYNNTVHYSRFIQTEATVKSKGEKKKKR
jgi:hypothetical protein